MSAPTDITRLIHDPARRAARQRVSIKATVLFDYLRPPPTPEGEFEDWAEAFANNYPDRLPPDDPFVFRDEDGDLAFAQPYAEIFLLSGAQYFGGALALVLAGETCYGQTAGSPARLNAALAKFRPLVLSGQLPSAAMLHKFLEVVDSPSDWLANQFVRHCMVPGRDYLYLPDDEAATPASCRGDGVGAIRLTPEMAATVAATTPTLRGRKMRACLVEPGVKPLDLAANDPELLELLFTPPARGLASL